MDPTGQSHQNVPYAAYLEAAKRTRSPAGERVLSYGR